MADQVLAIQVKFPALVQLDPAMAKAPAWDRRSLVGKLP